MNANEQIKMIHSALFEIANIIKHQQAELDSLRSVVYWLKENRPEVWDDIKKWSKM